MPITIGTNCYNKPKRMHDELINAVYVKTTVIICITRENMVNLSLLSNIDLNHSLNSFNHKKILINDKSKQLKTTTFLINFFPFFVQVSLQCNYSYICIRCLNT